MGENETGTESGQPTEWNFENKGLLKHSPGVHGLRFVSDEVAKSLEAVRAAVDVLRQAAHDLAQSGLRQRLSIEAGVARREGMDLKLAGVVDVARALDPLERLLMDLQFGGLAELVAGDLSPTSYFWRRFVRDFELFEDRAMRLTVVVETRGMLDGLVIREPISLGGYSAASAHELAALYLRGLVWRIAWGVYDQGLCSPQSVARRELVLKPRGRPAPSTAGDLQNDEIEVVRACKESPLTHDEVVSATGLRKSAVSSLVPQLKGWGLLAGVPGKYGAIATEKGRAWLAQIDEG